MARNFQMLNAHPMLRYVRPARLVIAGATVLGLITGVGLTVLFMARESAFKTCIIREMRGQPPIIMPDVQRLCSERPGTLLPTGSGFETLPPSADHLQALPQPPDAA